MASEPPPELRPEGRQSDSRQGTPRRRAPVNCVPPAPWHLAGQSLSGAERAAVRQRRRTSLRAFRGRVESHRAVRADPRVDPRVQGGERGVDAEVESLSSSPMQDYNNYDEWNSEGSAAAVLCAAPDLDTDSDSDTEMMQEAVMWDNNAPQFKENLMRYYDSNRPTRDNAYSRAMREMNMRNGLLSVVPDHVARQLEVWKVDNTVPATEAPFAVRPGRLWDVTAANIDHLGDLAIDDGAEEPVAVDWPASMLHIMDAYVAQFRKAHHVTSSKSKLMGIEQKALPVPQFHAALVKAAGEAGYPADSPFLIDLFKKKLAGGLSRAMRSQGVASLKVQMMQKHPATLQEAADMAEAVESELLEIAENECGLKHYNGGGEMAMAAAVLTLDDVSPEVVRKIQDGAYERVRTELSDPIMAKLDGMSSDMTGMAGLISSLTDKVASIGTGGRGGGKIKCWGCGEEGHPKRLCPKAGEKKND